MFPPSQLIATLAQTLESSRQFVDVLTATPVRREHHARGLPYVIVNPTATYYRRSTTRLNTLVSSLDFWTFVVVDDTRGNALEQLDTLRETIDQAIRATPVTLNLPTVTGRILLTRYAVASTDRLTFRESILARWVENWDGIDSPPIDTGNHET